MRLSKQARADTLPELRLRRLLHARGYRFLVNAPIPLMGGRRRSADLLFRGSRVAVFVDGCFWHFCPQHGTLPKSNTDWWRAKLERNRQRDSETDALAAAAGWAVVRVWEHDDVESAAERVARIVTQRISPSRSAR